MSDILKKAFFTGLGVAALSKDKLEEISKDFTEKGNMTEQEGRKFVEELSGYADRARGELEKQADVYVEKALKRTDLVRKSELYELRATVEELQTKLSDMQKQLDADGKGEGKE
jgi:polyhydroxyalkanoate synthesis regulator phasin